MPDRLKDPPRPTSAPAIGRPVGSVTTPWIRTPGSRFRSTRVRTPDRSSTRWSGGTAASSGVICRVTRPGGRSSKRKSPARPVRARHSSSRRSSRPRIRAPSTGEPSVVRVSVPSRIAASASCSTRSSPAKTWDRRATACRSARASRSRGTAAGTASSKRPAASVEPSATSSRASRSVMSGMRNSEWIRRVTVTRAPGSGAPEVSLRTIPVRSPSCAAGAGDASVAPGSSSPPAAIRASSTTRPCSSAAPTSAPSVGAAEPDSSGSSGASDSWSANQPIAARSAAARARRVLRESMRAVLHGLAPSYGISP